MGAVRLAAPIPKDIMETVVVAPKNRSETSHARVYHHWIRLPAWRELSVHAKALFVELTAQYRPNQPNEFCVPVSAVQRMLNCSRHTALKALDELETRGWIANERLGSMRGPKNQRPSVYSLCAYATYDAPARMSFLTYGKQRFKSDD